MERCLLALGGNQGVTSESFREAVDRLSESGIHVQQLGEVFRTRPVGAHAGGDFLNTAAIAETDLLPGETLRTLHAVEDAFGRTRNVHWGPRTMDLDLLTYGRQIIDQADLVVPHPSMWYRRFVLDPLVTIAADDIHPVFEVSIRELWQKLQPRPLALEIDLSGSGLDDSTVAGHLSRGSGGDRKGVLPPRLTTEFSRDLVRFQAASRVAPILAGSFAKICFAASVEPGWSREIRRSQPELNDRRMITLSGAQGAEAAMQSLRNVVSAATG